MCTNHHLHSLFVVDNLRCDWSSSTLVYIEKLLSILPLQHRRPAAVSITRSPQQEAEGGRTGGKGEPEQGAESFQMRGLRYLEQGSVFAAVVWGR